MSNINSRDAYAYTYYALLKASLLLKTLSIDNTRRMYYTEFNGMAKKPLTFTHLKSLTSNVHTYVR